MATDTKTKIFLTAAQLFATEGYDRVSIRKICERVGVGKPTLYYYFKDKESLLRELLQYSFELADEFIAEYVDNKSHFFQRLEGIIISRKKFMKKYPYFLKFFIMLNLQSIPANIRDDIIQRAKMHQSRLLQILHDGRAQGCINSKMDLKILASTLVGTLNHLYIKQEFLAEEKAMDDKNLKKLLEFWKTYLFQASN
jgi:AcrR family transcriptional regulator